MRIAVIAIGAVLFGLSLSGCRGWTSEEPPVHVNPNMDTQIKLKPYRESDYFADKRAMRPNVEGAVARGQLKSDDLFYRGMVNGKPSTQLPPQIELTHETLERGRDRFNIYCAPCHAASGYGNGLVGRRMGVKPTTFHSDYMHEQPIGHFFDVITNGIRTMPSYRDKLSEADRWKIAAYIRALQVSQDADGKWITKNALGK